MSGDLIKEKATYFLTKLYPGYVAFEFSNGWLEAFKNRHTIKSYCRFGESGSVSMTLIEESLPHIRLTLDQYEQRDIYNMYDSGLFYRMQAYNRRRFNRLLIQRLQDKVADPKKIDVLEAMRIAVAVWSMDVKLETIRNCFRHCQICTIDADVTSVLEQSLIDLDVIKELEEQVQELQYRNPMDICNLIDYPAKREVAYVPTEEEIVQDLSIDPVPEDEVEADDIQEYILVKTSEALQCASLLQHISMQQDIVDHEMIAAIQTVKDKIAL
ncbi:hypothetical protein AXG93_4413s1310 [Marchantia polymorpha subsp. ruderalis]|uniref:HTH CENPB-type domain-containing protein n=1 Tax=Marchantia polymorpha subsp. ruderalis TaxID=1480154 RepID=A0A176W447_MARPO|nr:hypothetical protein AXG93_4413s1310 [Marchantia polymorpha subsp. ruderalis]